jgi:hypothetical protein
MLNLGTRHWLATHSPQSFFLYRLVWRLWYSLSLSATASSYMCNTAPHVSSYNTHLHCCILCLHTDVARCFLKNHRDLTPDDCMQFDGLSQEITRAIQSLYPNANGKKGKVCVVYVLCG